MKKFTWVLIVAALVALVAAPAMAFANLGPHGSYVAETDLCAQCHRAHTAPSSLTWTDNQGGEKNALLLTDSAETYLFCLACHDTASQGADTNVMGGVYEGTAYGTQNADMISGAFGSINANLPAGAMYDSHGTAVTSTHLMNGQSWGAYGGGLYNQTPAQVAAGAVGGDAAELFGTGNKIVMTCTTCHDPHGSSNYRLLKSVVNGVPVGGYSGSTPTPYVISNEFGFPQTGFLLHVADSDYDPDYTVAQYAKAPGGDTDVNKGMTGWCVGCHSSYAVATRITFKGNTDYISNSSSVYNAGDTLGLVARHRHPMNVKLSNYEGAQPLVTGGTLGLPLAHSLSEQSVVQNGDVPTNDASDWIECLTCHNAHGSTKTMTGWADLGNPAVEAVVGDRGVMPADSNLLKMNNRGVCEACHNK